MSNPRIFSRLAPFGKSEKVNDVEVKNSYIKSSLSWWANDFQSTLAPFAPPPPRPPYLEEILSDGLTTCDLCGWAWGEKNFYSLDSNHQEEPSNDFMWIILLIIVSFSSAIVGAFIMMSMLKYRRSNSIRAFAVRSCTSKKQDFSTDQLCNETHKHQPSEMKKTSNIDLKFFMEDNTENDESFYATLNLNGIDENDQDSINSESENMNSYQKTAFSNKGDENVPSAPSSAYYSDLSNPPEKQYESIDSFNTFDRSDFNKCSGSSFITLNNNIITNRLSAISENNFSSQSRDVNSEYV